MYNNQSSPKESVSASQNYDEIKVTYMENGYGQIDS